VGAGITAAAACTGGSQATAPRSSAPSTSTETPTTSPPATSTAPTALPQALDCLGGQPEVRPQQLILACGDGTVSAYDLSWSTWNDAHAVGVGTVEVVQCEPSCAEGTPHSYPAMFE